MKDRDWDKRGQPSGSEKRRSRVLKGRSARQCVSAVSLVGERRAVGIVVYRIFLFTRERTKALAGRYVDLWSGRDTGPFSTRTKRNRDDTGVT